MAIRSGTGGLKYPLPANTDNQASIAAASSGGSAAASAFGANRQFAANRMRVQADLANSAADRQLRAFQQYQDQGFRANQAQQDRDFRAQQSELDRDFSAERQQAQFEQQTQLQQSGQQFSAQQAELDRGFTTQRDQAQFDQRAEGFEREIDAGIEADVRAGKLELSPQAQQQLDKIEADRAAMAAQNNLTPAQKEEFEAKAKAQERELMRTARPPRMPSATEQANARQTFYDPQTGKYETQMQPGRIPGSVGRDGQFQPTIDNSQQQQDQQKQVEGLYKDAQSIASEADAEGNLRFPNFDAALAEARRRRAAAGMPVPGQPGQPGATPPPAAPGQPGAPAPPAPGPGPQQPPGRMVVPPTQGMGDSARQRSGSDIQPAPAGFPQGSRMLDPDTVQLPDGRLLRRTGK